MTTTISCDCATHRGLSATVRGDGTGLNATKRHNLVAVAHSPLANTASGKAYGPWPAK